MGSELYGVQVESVRAGTVVLTVTTLHPDAGPPPSAPTFPVNLLVDLWCALEAGDGAARSVARREPWAPVFERLKALSRGSEELVGNDEYAAIERARASGITPTLRGRAVQAWGRANGQPFVSISGDCESFASEAARFVESYEVERGRHQEAYRRWPSDPSLRPEARLTVTVADPRLVGFVREGTTFESASYF